MKYKVTHATTYQYQSPVRVCHNLVMLTPREDDARVHEISHRLSIRPTPRVTSRRRDFFGNHLYAFSIEESHQQLTVTATSRLEIVPRPQRDLLESPAWEAVASGVAMQNDPAWLDVTPFVFDSRRVQRGESFRQYGAQSFAAGRPVADAALDLTLRIHTDFTYDTTATAVNTPTGEAFELRRGVCQDFAHIQIACLRSLGLPARYVSGYLRTEPPAGQPRLVGADQSHAWVSVYCGSDWGWVDVDPTNRCLCDTDHIPIAWGRDYQDVVPLRGVFLGGGQHDLAVSVDVQPLTVTES